MSSTPKQSQFKILVVEIFLILFSFIAIILRMMSKKIKVRCGLDDSMILLALISGE